MKPILFQCGRFTVYTYGVFVAIAFFVATYLLSRQARRRHLDENQMYNLCFVLLVSGLIGARLFYIGLNWDFFKTNMTEMFMLQHGGLVWFGGLIGALTAGLLFLKHYKMNIIATLDLLAPYVALVQAIGRIGCFFNGCCYGKESSFGFYVPAQHARLFPSQLLDSFTLLIIFVVLRFVQEKRKGGEVFFLYLILASLQRFFMEFFRGDERPFYGAFSIFQWISLGFFSISLVGYFILLWNKKRV